MAVIPLHVYISVQIQLIFLLAFASVLHVVTWHLQLKKEYVKKFKILRNISNVEDLYQGMENLSKQHFSRKIVTTVPFAIVVMCLACVIGH